jgi:hypothetical protein
MKARLSCDERWDEVPEVVDGVGDLKEEELDVAVLLRERLPKTDRRFGLRVLD